MHSLNVAFSKKIYFDGLERIFSLQTNDRAMIFRNFSQLMIG